MQFPLQNVLNLLDLAIAEDVGPGDITSALAFPKSYNPTTTARLISKARGVLAGLPVLPVVLAKLAPNTSFEVFKTEGDLLEVGDLVAHITGPVREILTAERTFLNFMQRMSGVASLAKIYADAATPARILDTRKTLPAWREIDKYSVKVGGAENHRMGLYDMVLIKDNHIAAAGGVRAVLQNVFAELPQGMKVEIEVENEAMLREALEFPIHRIMLDNMPLEQMRSCVQIVRQIQPQVEIEASGNMTLDRLPSVASTGVDFISVGAITHSVPVFDLSLRIA